MSALEALACLLLASGPLFVEARFVAPPRDAILKKDPQLQPISPVAQSYPQPPSTPSPHITDAKPVPIPIPEVVYVPYSVVIPQVVEEPYMVIVPEPVYIPFPVRNRHMALQDEPQAMADERGIRLPTIPPTQSPCGGRRDSGVEGCQ